MEFLRPTEMHSHQRGWNFDIALLWLDDCITKHDVCSGKEAPSNFLPTRLIDVGTAEDFSDVRLRLKSEIPTCSRYLTLSHRWGSLDLYRLRKSNLHDFERQIPYEELCRTFQDAIKVTRQLFRQYQTCLIWIDSLCIIQDADQDEDWKREVLRMEAVYKHAFCNNAATSGLDGNSGLFLDSHHSGLGHTIVTLPWSGKEGVYVVEDLEEWENEVGNSTLLRRCWVTQEYFLSRRIIFFTSDQLFWTCGLLPIASELHPEGTCAFPGSLLKKYHKKSRTKSWNADTYMFYQPYEAEYFDRRLEVYKAWNFIIHQYSKGSLSRPNDKLAAVAGLASDIQRHLQGQDEYLAGLWKTCLQEQLL